MGFHIQVICDEGGTVPGCVSKFTETSPSSHSKNDRASVSATVTALRERAAFHGWKQQPNGDMICPICAKKK